MEEAKEWTPQCLQDLEIMFQNIVVDGSASCVPGEIIGDENTRADLGGDGGDGSRMSITNLKRGASSSATSPRKRVRSPMVKIMKTISEIMQENSDVAQRVISGENRSQSIK